ncbi:MAG: hypothetical protein QNJ46_16425 [Leptolyngbyaceae cyanobacterium MO_188.B28]|nr:hypothetical protein [Leptolyngbyaceae cyanobacterium MO_188.B28]
MAASIIRAITPLFLASIGGIIGVAAVLTPSTDDARWSSALGLAGTAIAGAAGLAQSNDKNESNVLADQHKSQDSSAEARTS